MERNIVYCLLCNKPQDSIATHLKRVCMKAKTPEEQVREVSRARTSQKIFAREGRVWDFPELREFCKDVASCLTLCHRLQSRGFIVTNTPPNYQTTEPTPGDCCVQSQKKDVLDAAKEEIDYIQKRIVSGDCIPNGATTSFRHYCEAIMLLQHRLTANAVMELSVQDWIDRKPVRDGVSIQLSTLNPTARAQSFTLTNQEEGLFECYFHSIRPLSLQHHSGDKDDKGKFFLGESGVPLSNPASDLQRLKAKYMPLEPKAAVASSASASTSDPLTGEAPLEQDSAFVPTVPESVRQWDAFRSTFPVTLNGDPPSKEQFAEAGFPHYRSYYHKWRELQHRQRTEYILRHSVDRKGNRPKAARVQIVLDKETKWTTNKPTANAVLKAWVPPQKTIKDNNSIIISIIEQKWKGMALKDFGEEKGKGVIAAMPFNKGDVICDYHGTVISEAEGKQRPQSGYLFFFKGDSGRGLCLDATAFPCACHPDKDTYGRRLRHSIKDPNVKPQKFTLNFPDGPQETILFVAQRDIRVDEELLWNYRGKFCCR